MAAAMSDVSAEGARSVGGVEGLMPSKFFDGCLRVLRWVLCALSAVRSVLFA